MQVSIIYSILYYIFTRIFRFADIFEVGMKTFSNEKFRGGNPNFKKTAFFFLRFEAEFFFSPCHHARHLQQIHWFKIFCRMYGLAVMLTIPTSSTCLLLIRWPLQIEIRKKLAKNLVKRKAVIMYTNPNTVIRKFSHLFFHRLPYCKHQFICWILDAISPLKTLFKL